MRSSFGLLRTQAFRIVLVYVLLFAFSVGALLIFTYWNTRRTLDEQTSQIIEAEMTGLNEQYQRLGVRGLYDSVMNRSLHAGQALYIPINVKHRLMNQGTEEAFIVFHLGPLAPKPELGHVDTE